MGQLIKLQDYVSRYERDIFLYPSRFVRLKKQQWDKLHQAWEEGGFPQAVEEPQTQEWFDKEKEPFLHKIKGFLKKGKQEIEQDEVVESEESSFAPSFTHRPTTVDELKRHFLEQLFHFQMKWASTTLAEKTYVNKKYYYDDRLKYFLQRFPDTFLVLYQPIFLLKKAPVEVESIVITPTDIWCISFLEQEESAVFVGSNDHFWTKRNQKQEEKVLNPLLGLNRTEKIVKQVLKMYEIELPVHKVVLSRNGYIDFPAVPYDIKLIEKRNYEQWFQQMRAHRSPLKHVQLKAAQSLLQYCLTTSVRRVEWESESEQ